jgi:hypothetical protein
MGKVCSDGKNTDAMMEQGAHPIVTKNAMDMSRGAVEKPKVKKQRVFKHFYGEEYERTNYEECTLEYFEGHGRSGPIQLLLVFAKCPFEQRFVSIKKWKAEKSN